MQDDASNLQYTTKSATYDPVANRKTPEAEAQKRAVEAYAKNRKRAKAPAGTVKYRYDSQRDPQLSRTRLGLPHAWIIEGIERYQADFLANHGLKMGVTTIARDALKTMLLDRHGALKLGVLPEPVGTAATIGPFRLPEPYSKLPETIAKIAKRNGTTESDVVRHALAQWLTERGYDKPGKKRPAR